MRMRTSPAAGFPAIRSRWPMGPRGSRRATRREAVSSIAPLRRQVLEGEDRRGLAGRGAEPLRELGERAHVGAAELVDGLVRVADRDQLRPSPASASSSDSWAGSLSWYSSTNTTSYAARSRCLISSRVSRAAAMRTISA